MQLDKLNDLDIDNFNLYKVFPQDSMHYYINIGKER